MSKLELQLFLDFATHYFSYNQKCREKGEPTLLGKIVGVYTVSFRNSSSNSALKSNLLIMENLFYKRDVVQKYDLKGSVRNRLVNPSHQNEGEVVYLDENLLKSAYLNPRENAFPYFDAMIFFWHFSDNGFSSVHTAAFAGCIDEGHRERHTIPGVPNSHGLFFARRSR